MQLREMTGRAGSVARLTTEAADGSKLWHLPVQVVQAAKVHRTTGHAAEMAFFAVLTLVPSTVAVGSMLALSKGVVGAGVVNEAESAALKAVSVLMGPELTDAIIAPFITRS